MNNTVKNILIFVAGLAVGGSTAYVIARKQFEKKTDEEIKLVRAGYDRFFSSQIKAEEEAKQEKPVYDELIDNSQTKAKQHSYVDYTKFSKYSKQAPEGVIEALKTYNGANDDEETDEREDYIYLISEEEFNQSENEAQSLIIYNDGIIADDDYNMVSGDEHYIGQLALNNMPKDDNWVYVRNDKLNIDYELTFDTSNYEDVCPANRKLIRPETDEDDE